MINRPLFCASLLAASLSACSPNSPATPTSSPSPGASPTASASPDAAGGVASLVVKIDDAPVTVKNTFYDKDASISPPARPLFFGADVVTLLGTTIAVFKPGADQWGVQVNVNQKALSPHLTFANAFKLQFNAQHGTGATGVSYNGLSRTPVTTTPKADEALFEVTSHGDTDDIHIIATLNDFTKKHADIKLELTATGVPSAQ